MMRLETILKILVNKIRDRRVELKMTQAKLARLSGVSQNAISQYERGDKIPRVDYALMLAGALKCNVEELFEIVHT